MLKHFDQNNVLVEGNFDQLRPSHLELNEINEQADLTETDCKE